MCYVSHNKNHILRINKYEFEWKVNELGIQCYSSYPVRNKCKFVDAISLFSLLLLLLLL